MEETADRYWRITAFLPVGTTDEVLAAGKVAKELGQKPDGFTNSVSGQPVFEGFWRDRQGEWLNEEVSMLIIDYPAAREEEIREVVQKAGKFIWDSYLEFTSKEQDIIWITYQELSVVPYVNPTLTK